MTRLASTLLSLATAVAVTACGGSSPSSATAAGAASGSGRGGAERRQFLASAIEHPDFTVTLPLHRGTSQGRTIWYVVIDASDGDEADAFGVPRVQKLERARGTAAVQETTRDGEVLDFPATVRFGVRPRVVVPSDTGFPPLAAAPSSDGEEGYTPLAGVPGGGVLNAPHVANDSGLHPKVVEIDFDAGTVTLEETAGFANGKAVRYVSMDASLDVAAALENVVYAPALNAAPTAGEDGTDQARASLAAFVNGRTGRDEPERQGLNSALLDGLSPLNVLAWTPNQGRYSPLWDAHLAAWTAEAIANGDDLRQTDFDDVRALADDGLVTAPDGTAFAASGFIVNCPVISEE
jgi:hypothetical protein